MSIPQNTFKDLSFSGAENANNSRNTENFSSELPKNQEGFESVIFRKSFDSALKDLLDKNKITHEKGNLLTVQFEKAKDPKKQLEVLGGLQELQNPVSAENTGFFRDKPHYNKGVSEVSDSVRSSPVLGEISIAKNPEKKYNAQNSAEEEQKKIMQELAKQQAEQEEAEKKRQEQQQKTKKTTRTVASGGKKTSRKLIKWVAIGVAGSTAGLGFLV